MAKIDTSVTEKDVLPEGDAQIPGTAEADIETSDESVADIEIFDASEFNESESRDEESISDDRRLYGPLEFRPPTYTSDNCPRLPQELIELICEFNRDYPLVLATCMHVCCAWYHTASHVLGMPSPVSGALSLRTQADLRSYAHRLLSARKSDYSKRFKKMDVYDNPRKPFVHVWPIHIPGGFLPRMTRLRLHGIDWTNTNRNGVFYKYLSSYSSVLYLSMDRCSFRTGREFRRIIDALPSLADLSLSNITLQYPPIPEPVPSLVTARYKKLKAITADEPDSLPSSIHDSGHGEAVSMAGALDMCAVYSSISELHLDLSYFPSVPSLLKRLLHFPQLHDLQMNGAFQPDQGIGHADTDASHVEYTLPRGLLLLRIGESSALQLLRLLSTSHACSILENLHLHLESRPSAEFVLCVTDILRLCGPRLKLFDWEANGEVVPQLKANMSLKRLYVMLNHVTQRLWKIQRILNTVLSDITSTRLEEVWIDICLDSLEQAQTAITETFERANTPDSTFAFHSILSRSIFASLPYVGGHQGVHIKVSFTTDELPWSIPGRKRKLFMLAIKFHMLALFAPWLDRGVLELRFWPDPDGEE